MLLQNEAKDIVIKNYFSFKLAASEKRNKDSKGGKFL
jgi:hypothetical protein